MSDDRTGDRTGDRAGAAAPLRSTDPARLGAYRLLGRLGEGGMGTVFLASGPGDDLVAVKMVRVDLASDDEFRRRFRSEVNRVKQVPPFCTAEVLDADPDHEHPYLVVEYVDGPSLADVVQSRGRLTSSNLHGVAIGVATALTAIHGAGVIHRDLKPRNVLLAPGSPKVIDFGIARAFEATSQHTRTDQMVGTVAYMAPERFEGDATITAAADIFAWGAVVAYAGTGRTPFQADSAPATAVRILTQEPDLSGLTGSLRELVAASLAKDPQDRPTARDLLDLLLAAGPQRSAAAAAALKHQPALADAVHEAQAATGYAPERDLTAAAAPAPLVGHTDAPTHPASPAASATEILSGRPREHQTEVIRAQGAGSAPGFAAPTQAAAHLTGGSAFTVPTQQGPAYGPHPGAGHPGAGHPGAGHLAGGHQGPGHPGGAHQGGGHPGGGYPGGPPGYGPPPQGPPARPPRRRWVAPVLALVTVLLLTGLGAAAWARFGPGWQRDGGQTPVTQGSTAPAAKPVLEVEDALRGQRLWEPVEVETEKASCYFDDALVAERAESTGTLRCRGPRDDLPADQRVQVDVRLLTAGSCAAFWLRFADNRGYQVRVCADRVMVGAHVTARPSVYQTIPLDEPLKIGGDPATFTVSIIGDTIEVERDGSPLGGPVQLRDEGIGIGRIVLGIFTEDPGPGHKPPYRVAYTDVKIWSLAG